MSKILTVGIIINTLTFGLNGFLNNKLGIKMPKFLDNKFVRNSELLLYYGSFIIILLSPEKLWLKVLICIGLQFLINHILWGGVAGIWAGWQSRIERKKIRKDAYKNYEIK